MIVQSHEYQQGTYAAVVTITPTVERKSVAMRIVPSKDKSSNLNQAFIDAAVAVLKAARKQS